MSVFLNMCFLRLYVKYIWSKRKLCTKLRVLRLITSLLKSTTGYICQRVNNVIVLNVFCLALYFSKRYFFWKIMNRTIFYKPRPIFTQIHHTGERGSHFSCHIVWHLTTLWFTLRSVSIEKYLKLYNYHNNVYCWSSFLIDTL